MADLPDLFHVEGFDWDKSNILKNWERHRVAFDECEEVFFHDPVFVPDFGQASGELRYFAYGRTVRKRFLTIVFTMRGNKVRVISARDMSRKERIKYGQV